MKCPECKNQVMREGFEIFCPKCGLVIEDEPIINEGVTQNAEFFSDLTYSDTIFRSYKRDVELVCSFFRVPRFVERESLSIFNECLKKKLSEGRTLESLALASFYLATKVQKFDFNLENLRDFDRGLDLDYLTSLAQKISETLEINIKIKSDLVEEIGKKLNLSKSVLSKAKELLKSKELFRNKSEKARIVSVFYFLSKKSRPLLDFCRVGNVSVEVIKNLVEVLENGQARITSVKN